MSSGLSPLQRELIQVSEKRRGKRKLGEGEETEGRERRRDTAVGLRVAHGKTEESHG